MDWYLNQISHNTSLANICLNFITLIIVASIHHLHCRPCLVNLRSMSYHYLYITVSPLSHSIIRNITLLLPPLLPLRLVQLLLLLLLLLPSLLLLDSPAFCLSTTSSTRRSSSCTWIDCLLFKFLFFHRHRFPTI